MRIHQAILAFLILILLAAGGFAQELTLEEAWQIALKNNLTLQQVEKSIRQAEEEIKIQRSGFLPTLGGFASYRYQSEIPQLELPFQLPTGSPLNIEAGFRNQYDLNVAVQQPIFTGFRTRFSVSAAKEQFQAQLAGKTAAEHQLLLQIGRLYYQIQSNLLQQQIISQSIRRADNQLQQVRSLLRADQAIPFDTLEIANRKLQQQILLKNLENVHQILRSQFNYLLNVDEALSIHRIEVDTLSLTLNPLTAYQQMALDKRPELNQVNAFKKAQSNRVRIFRSAMYPQIYASASYHYARPGVNFFEDEWMTYYTVGINLQWSLWNWGRDFRKVKQARYEYEQLDLQNQDLIERIQQQVEETYRQLENVREQIALQRRLTAQERRRYEITEQRYSQGQATSLDLADAEKNLTQADLMLQDKYVEWHQYKLQLEYATGNIGN